MSIKSFIAGLVPNIKFYKEGPALCSICGAPVNEFVRDDPNSYHVLNMQCTRCAQRILDSREEYLVILKDYLDFSNNLPHRDLELSSDPHGLVRRTEVSVFCDKEEKILFIKDLDTDGCMSLTNNKENVYKDILKEFDRQAKPEEYLWFLRDTEKEWDFWDIQTGTLLSLR
jgi:DNA-directed RNA polymerase subunit RPC12/RpoP